MGSLTLSISLILFICSVILYGLFKKSNSENNLIKFSLEILMGASLVVSLLYLLG